MTSAATKDAVFDACYRIQLRETHPFTPTDIEKQLAEDEALPSANEKTCKAELIQLTKQGILEQVGESNEGEIAPFQIRERIWKGIVRGR